MRFLLPGGRTHSAAHAKAAVSVDPELMKGLREHAGALHGAIERIQQDLDAVSGRVDQEADAFQSLVALGEQLGGLNDTTKAAATEAGDATTRAGQAVAESRETLTRSLEDIHALTGAVAAIEQQMTALDGALEEVNSAADTIATIAKQTNLLALNATIEATRAGDHGRGFAVVAEHVKELAKQASATTEDIGAILGELRDCARQLIEAASECGRIQETVSTGTATTQTLLETVDAAMASLDGIYERINASVEQIDGYCRETVDGLQGMADDVGTARETLAEARDDARGLQQTATDLASGLEAPDAGDGRIIESTAAATGTLTVQVSDIAGNAAQVRDRVNEEVDMLGRLAGTAGQLAATGQDVHAAADEARSTAESTAGSLRESGDDVHEAVSGLQEMTTQVDHMTSGLGRFQDALERIQKASSSIAAIAKQTNLLAVNASIEAARSGSAGQGFGVVAEQIGTLAEETGEATRNIQRTVEGLAASARSLMDKGRDGADRAERVRADSRNIGDVLATLESAMDSVASQSGRIRDAATEMGQTCSQVDSGLGQQRQEVEHSARDLGSASEHLDELLGKGEALLNLCNSTDADTPDRPMIEQARYGAAQAGAALEKAIAEGRLSEADVFDRDHVPVPGTNPQQYTTRYVNVTDQLFPAFQEEVLEAHEKIISCCCTDNHGYIGTHNRHTSKPQRPDNPDWNRANSRHRQMYTDRVGLGAARNTRSFLLQAYRRNMGGKFVLTKDASAPIYVHGRHWGACRVIYVP